MAGDWIPMRTELREDPAVIAISARLDLDEDTVVGKLHRFWSWANKQTADGNAPSVSKTWIERYLCVSGFADALEEVGWLTCSEGGICIPNFERWNSQSAKRRILTCRRVARHKVTHGALPRVEKRRVEKKTSPNGEVPLQSPAETAFAKWWETYPRQRRQGKAAAKACYQKAVARVAKDRGITTDDARHVLQAAVEAFAESPKGQGDYCPGPCPWLNQGRWDDAREAWQDAGGHRDQRQPLLPAVPQLTDQDVWGGEA